MTFISLEESIRGTPFLSLRAPLSYMEVLRDNLGVPAIICQAKGLKRTLENLPILIRPDEIIVGTLDDNIPVAIPRLEGSGFRIMKELDILPDRKVNPINLFEDDKSKLRDIIAPFYENFRVETYAREIAPESVFDVQYSGCTYIATEIGGIAHAVINYPDLLSIGLKKFIELSRKNIKKYRSLLDKDPQASKKIAFYKSIIIISDALIAYSLKFADKAEKLAEFEEDTSRKSELLRIAQCCKYIPENSPRNLQEAIQFVWFVHMALHIENFEHGISFGRIDQYLLPYYNGDDRNALRLFKNLCLKSNEIIALYDSVATQYFGGMATTQNILIGGYDKNGRDATNPLTYLVLKAIDEASNPSPNLVVRINRKTPHELYKSISNILSKGKNVIGLYNDELVINSLMKHGIPLDEARDYGIVGCVGLSTSGTSFDNTGAVFLNLPKALEIALGTDKTLISKYVVTNAKPAEYNSMEEILVEFEKALRSIVKMSVIVANSYQIAHKVLKPTPLMSLCIKGCFKQGVDVNHGPAKYNFSGIHVTGFTDVVDSLAAIDWGIFTVKHVPMETLLQAIRKNFRGFKELHSFLLNKCPKYGNDDDRADIFAKKVVEIISNSVKGFKCARGGGYRMGIHAMTSHVGFGVFTGALPSGRKKGKPLNRDISPGFSGEKGLTAAINSIAKIDHSLLGNGVACTLNIDPDLPKINNGEILESVIKTYVNLKGSHLQFNAISSDVLKDAQDHPVNYKNFMIRVSGYSARFVDLPKAVQDDIMTRYCYKN